MKPRLALSSLYGRYCTLVREENLAGCSTKAVDAAGVRRHDDAEADVAPSPAPPDEPSIPQDHVVSALFPPTPLQLPA